MKYLLIVLIFSSCANKSTPPLQALIYQEPISYEIALKNHIESIKKENDTTFLGFVLGGSKEQTLKHLTKLMKESKTFRSESKEFSAKGNLDFTLIGNPYTVYLENRTELPGVFELAYLDNKLLGIRFQVYKNFDIETVRKLIKSKYGPCVNKKFEVAKITYTWLVNNTEIQAEWGGINGFGEIRYFDLKRKVAYDKHIFDTKNSADQRKQKLTKNDI